MLYKSIKAFIIYSVLQHVCAFAYAEVRDKNVR